MAKCNWEINRKSDGKLVPCRRKAAKGEYCREHDARNELYKWELRRV